jgi:succinoglycan biosynthesis protein ExoO
MRFSVLIPAFRAQKTIKRAVASIISQRDVAAEIVICADDGADYATLLRDLAVHKRQLVVCRTPRIQSGPSVARNIAFANSSAAWIASLDADDEFSPGRLARLRSTLEKTGVATGPTIELTEIRQVMRIAKPIHSRASLTVQDIAEIRMPYAPVFHRSFFHHGWPDTGFAEDMIFNVGLLVRSGIYGFVGHAGYRYYLSDHSISGSADSLMRATSAYKRILKSIHSFDWPKAIQEKVRKVIQEDLERAEFSLSSELTAQHWRKAVRGT